MTSALILPSKPVLERPRLLTLGFEVIDWMEACLVHTEGEWRGQPFRLLLWQKRLLLELFTLVEDEEWVPVPGQPSLSRRTFRQGLRRRFRQAFITLPKKQGKALAFDTPIATPSGWTIMGELSVGDTVFDEAGRPSRVTYATQAMLGHDCYRVTFNDGSSLVADADHRWYVEPRWAQPTVLTTAEMVGRTDVGNGHRFRIPLASPLDTPAADLPIAPYTLGAWLGAGNSRSARLTTADEEVLRQIEADGYRTSERIEQGRGSTTRGIGVTDHRPGSLSELLRREGLFGDKRIPQAYLRASVSQRLSLLQGLMDTDGYVSRRGQCEFTTTRRVLADGVLELVRSLGMKPRTAESRARLEGRDVGPKWRIQFFPPIGMPVVRLARKLERQQRGATMRRRSESRYITSIEPVPSVAVRCIQVDSSSHLYLAGRAMVPTHNTELAAAIALYLLIGDGEPSPKGVFAAGSLKQAGLSFRAGQTMLLESPVLSQLVTPRHVGDLVIEVPSIPGSRLERVAAEAGTNDGPSLHFGVLDEVHEWEGEGGKKVHGVITNAGAARKNPLFVSISTLGEDEDDPEQVWVDLYERGRSAQDDPSSDPTFYFYCVKAPDGADWQDRAVWEAANPSANVTVSWSFYQSEWPKGEKWCRRYYLNQPSGGTSDPWMDEDLFEGLEGEAKLRPLDPAYASVRVARDGRSAGVAIAQRRGHSVVVQGEAFEADDLEEGDVLSLADVEAKLLEWAHLYRGRVIASVQFTPGGRKVVRQRPGPEVTYHGSFFERSRQLLEAKGLVMVARPDSQAVLLPGAQLVVDLVRAKRLEWNGEDLGRHVGHVVGKEVRTGAVTAVLPVAPVGKRRRIEAALALIHAVGRAMDPELRPPSRRVRGL